MKPIPRRNMLALPWLACNPLARRSSGAAAPPRRLLAAGAGPRLVEWERGIALQPPDEPATTMYLWFYEWNMFEAMAPGQHTSGTYKLDRRIDPATNEALITSPALRLHMKPTADGAEMLLTVNNRTRYSWPATAAIIPCWSPGVIEGLGPGKPPPKTVIFADREHDKTEFLSAKGVVPLTSRAIHFNHTLGLRGEFVFSDKWPTSEEDAHAGVLVRQATGGKWVTGIAWEDYLSLQGHNPWYCMHLAVRVGPLAPRASKTIRGRLWLFPGTSSECWRRARRFLKLAT